MIFILVPQMVSCFFLKWDGLKTLFSAFYGFGIFCRNFCCSASAVKTVLGASARADLSSFPAQGTGAEYGCFASVE